MQFIDMRALAKRSHGGSKALSRIASAWIRSVQIAKATLSEFWQDRIPTEAAAMTFFLLLALFPGLASLVSLYGLFAHRSSIVEVVRTVAPYLPHSVTAVLSRELHDLLLQKRDRLNLAFVVGFLVSIWSASGGVTALVAGLNVAYETKERRSVFQLSINALLFTVALLALALLVVGLLVVSPTVIQRFWYFKTFINLLSVLRWPLTYCGRFAVFSLIYRLGPDRHPKVHWLNWGSALGTALWMAATVLFGWYVQNFGRYERVYGDLAAAVGFLTWVWISLSILLAGAELNCELSRSNRR